MEVNTLVLHWTSSPQHLSFIAGATTNTQESHKVISGLMGYTYEDRLNILKLTTLETRRLRCDLIEVFKMFKAFDNLDPLIFLE